MKVIFIKDMARVAQRGEIKEFATGYAMNVLIAKGYAIMATPAELSKIRQKEEQSLKNKKLAENMFDKLVDELKKTKVVIKDKKNDNGHLFAHISREDIIEAIENSCKIPVTKEQIIIDEPIKKTGEHNVCLTEGKRKCNVKIIVQ